MTRKIVFANGVESVQDCKDCEKTVENSQAVIQDSMAASLPEGLPCSNPSLNTHTVEHPIQSPQESDLESSNQSITIKQPFKEARDPHPLPCDYYFQQLCLDPNIGHYPTWRDPDLSVDMDRMTVAFNVDSLPPFKDPLETLGVQPYDVLKIKNVPYAVSIQEIKSFVARLTPSPLILDHVQGYPVHIIMERSTAKTMECYVEFQNKGAARAAVERAEKNVFQNKPLKMGSRHIDLEVSSEGELCAALFPRAKSVKWDPTTGVPVVKVNQDPYSDGFAGFFTVEEITNVCKHAANPQKSTFSQRCQQRVYESMISTLYKFPWHVPEFYSVNARDFLLSTYMEMLQILLSRVSPSGLPFVASSPHRSLDREVGLGHTLLMDFLFAGLNTPMFSLRQKFAIAQAAYPLGPGFGVEQQAVAWPFEALVPDKSVASDVIDDWLRVMSVGHQKLASMSSKHKYAELAQVCRDNIGYLKIELSDSGKRLSFHQLTILEKTLMEVLIEQGRSEWCKANNTPYQTLATLRLAWDQAEVLQRSVNVDGQTNDDFKLSSATTSSDFGSAASNLSVQATYHSREQDSIVDGMNNMAIGEGSAETIDGHRYFNPATPSFIPSQPWTDLNTTQDRQVMPNAAVPQLPYSSIYQVPLVPPSSWDSRGGLPDQCSFDNWQASALSLASQQQATWYSNSAYDPFASDITPPPGRRRTSLSSARRTVSNPGGSLDFNVAREAGSGRGTPYQSRKPAAEAPTVNSGHAFSSPGRDGRSRSSLGHKSVYIQPTIDEEGDMSAGENIDDGPDAGGVSLDTRH